MCKEQEACFLYQGQAVTVAPRKTHQSSTENSSVAGPQRALGLKSDYYADESSPEGS